MKTDLASTSRAVDNLYAPFLRSAEEDPYHEVFRKFVHTYVKAPGPRILELGSREVSGNSRRGLFSGATEYIGVDIIQGPGVDLVADAHRLSEVVPSNHFDVVYSISVFEHLVFPWRVVMEINTVLKIGGLCYVSTHPAWPPHELPWDFWRFPKEGLKALFNRDLGFEVCECAEGVMGKLHSLAEDPPARGVSSYE